MQKTIRFNIMLPLNSERSIKHLKEVSRYDHNYYELPTYGDWIFYGRQNNNVLRERYDEWANQYDYALGRFDEGKFIDVLSWGGDGVSILDGISIE